MLINKLIPCLFLVSILAGCKEGDITAQTKQINAKQKDSVAAEVVTQKVADSFVLSCGSGCAMTYTEKSVSGKSPVFKVKFQVEMFEDEQLSDTYEETYIFNYDASGTIKDIHLDGKKDNVLQTLMPNAQSSFRDFSEKLVKGKQTGNKSGSQKIIYEKKTNPEKAVYQKIKTSTVKGLSEFSCGESETRYIALPDKSDIRLMLVPQDCGDFTYRYYLLTVKNNAVAGHLYAEGEFSEPDGEDDKELTSFMLSDEFVVTVKTMIQNVSSSKKYQITKDGKIQEL